GVWHWSTTGHMTTFVPVHTPPWQVSVCVHGFPSLHTTPSGLGGLLHTPFTGLHAPASWHASSGVQTTGLPPMHTPAWQTSPCVQAWPSLHAVPVSWVHVPSAVAPAATLHAWQSPATPPPHDVLQQTPSTQLPLRQSEGCAHPEPFRLAGNVSAP